MSETSTNTDTWVADDFRIDGKHLLTISATTLDGNGSKDIVEFTFALPLHAFFSLCKQSQKAYSYFERYDSAHEAMSAIRENTEAELEKQRATLAVEYDIDIEDVPALVVRYDGYE